jgi:8-oxo-dGTP diphosphatase
VTAVAVDVALLAIEAGRLTVLLVEPESADLAGTWSLPGRRVRDDESLDTTALRALRELAGIERPTLLLEQLRTYGAPTRDPRARVVSVAYLALSGAPLHPAPGPRPGPRAVVADAAEVLDWPPARFAYDHAAIVADAIERVRSRLEYTALATALLPAPFTLAALRGVYEAVWGGPLDPANFRRKVLATPGFVVPAPGPAVAGPGGGRPARRYAAGGATRLHPAMLRDR